MTLTLFYVFAAAMMVLLGFVLLRTIMNPAARDENNHREVNIGIARDRKSLIKDALSKGHIDQDTFDTELKDIETTLANELAEGPNSTQSRAMRVAGIVFILGLLGAVSAVLYERLGTTNAMQDPFLAQAGAVILPNGATVNTEVAAALQAGADPKTAAEQAAAAVSEKAQGPGSLDDLLPQLEARLAENPDDAQGWMLLGRTYMNLGEFAKAQSALEKVNELDDSNPEMILMLAESVALQKQGDLIGEPQTLIKKALAIDPDNQRGQLLLGLSHQQSGEHETAIAQFEKLRSNPEMSEQGIANLTQMIDQSRVALGQEPEAPVANSEAQSSEQTTDQLSEQNTAPSTEQGVAQAAESKASLTVQVELNDQARAAVNDTDSVFIFARASSGPPMPLAVVRMTVADLPATVTLDDSQAMIPNMTLSTFPSVTIGARVSPIGDAIAKPGDWFGQQENVMTASDDENAAGTKDTPLQIVIDQQTP